MLIQDILTPDSIRMWQVILQMEELERMCDIVEASDLVEFDIHDEYNIGHAQAMLDAVNFGEEHQEIDRYTIREWHSMLFPNGGTWRTCNVRISGSKEIPPDYSTVDQYMYMFVQDMYYILNTTMNPLVKLAEIHLKFVRIHCFSDGNGRIARVLLNYCAAYLNMPAIKIDPTIRDAYIDAINHNNAQELATVFNVCLV